MVILNLREVDGATVVTLPQDVLDRLQLRAGAAVTLAVEGDRLVIASPSRLRPTLERLLAESDYSVPPDAEQREWIDAPAVGREAL